MSETCGQIRILWIDDCEGADAGKYAYPESELPPDLCDWFTIVRHSNIPGPSSIRTPRDFWTLFERFWNRSETNLFPVEIVAMDYNLRKWRDPSASRAERSDDDDGMGSDKSSDGEIATGTGATGQREVGFEGLVTGVFASAMLSAHPTGLVPMTHYADDLLKVPEVRALHNLSTPLLRVDYTDFHISGEGRSWRNILRKGVESLRDRMEILFLDGDVSLSFDDLMRLSEGTGDRLTVRSKYCVRSLPVQGLFLDAENWREAARAWSIGLVKDIVQEDSLEALVESRKVAETLWDAYNDDEMFGRRLRLSTLHSKKDTIGEGERNELEGLYQLFEVANPESNRAACTRNIADLRAIPADGATLRWVCLRVLVKILARYVHSHKNCKAVAGEDMPALDMPACVNEDWMVAMFPVAQSPIVLPFEGGPCSDYLTTAWGTWMRNHLLDHYMLNPKHVLDGHDFGEAIEVNGREAVAGGLRDSERQILRMIALTEPGISEADWRGMTVARNVLWGKDS